MVDAHALGACGLGRAGSNPASPTRVGFEVCIDWLSAPTKASKRRVDDHSHISRLTATEC